MEILYMLAAALAPVVVCLWYITHKDRNNPEPTGELVKAFFMGTLSVPISLCISIPLHILGTYSGEDTTVIDAIANAFLGAAIPEEIAKLIILWLVLRKNLYFDEKFDGIVYATFVSMGFAAVENIMYLISSDSWLGTGIMRALFSIPGHLCFGILMGYYYSLARFYSHNRTWHAILTLVAPVMAHGIYDAILMSTEPMPGAWTLLSIAFVYFFYRMIKLGRKRIDEHLARDRAEAAAQAAALAATQAAATDPDATTNDDPNTSAYMPYVPSSTSSTSTTLTEIDDFGEGDITQ